MKYEAVRIGNVTVDKKDVLLFEVNGIDVKNYSLSEIGHLYDEPNIRLKFKNNKEKYCGDTDMLFIFGHNYMREIYLPYKTGKDGINRCEIEP